MRKNIQNFSKVTGDVFEKQLKEHISEMDKILSNTSSSTEEKFRNLIDSGLWLGSESELKTILKLV